MQLAHKKVVVPLLLKAMEVEAKKAVREKIKKLEQRNEEAGEKLE